MRYSSSKLLLVLMSGLLIITVMTACSNQDSSPKDKVQELDYKSRSQEISKEVEGYFNNQDLDIDFDIAQQAEKKQEVDGKRIIWNLYSQQVALPFPATPQVEVSKLIKGLKEELDEEDLRVSIKKQNLVKENWELLLEVSFEPEELEEESLVAYRLQLTQPRIKAKMAFLIDDLGFNRQGTEETMSINRQISVAVLPFRPYSTQDAKLAKQAGHEVLLHLPMEPISKTNPGQGAIYTDMSANEIRRQIKNDIADLGVRIAGVNNHMGSKATGDRRVMEVVLNYLNERGLFFVDSSTAPQSAVPVAAQKLSEPYGMNYLFIDNIDKKESVKKQINKIAKVALRKGNLITIGHVRTNTALAIKEMIPKLEAMGIQLVYVSELIE
ncbi:MULTISPECIES: divergent polysaccharide deacetylase family protein [unclassified Candidatus Frackibacter]|uniref:divergent polysaccharide deacetylase family protein n=1 Tax=unclassified Candidatus Frackibacter TaxID=2648818 RepID=UPI00087F101C|nr:MULTISPECIES: divergent polysaccharide deacetylase family protein [unclassified Candidatus Frackibacter]SDC83484.1 hypothetical protein SAMN04515661_1293 [Candidatus Frackibacter sp. WG11]SEM97970.1 hypothetical protein SAMN04488698_1314 [Candidatus Frackibacter sp. WG12]SFM04718.1 hypothetical protein SAMN04488699_1294 [Candidatus Frackibacter sp. WG13]